MEGPIWRWTGENELHLVALLDDVGYKFFFVCDGGWIRGYDGMGCVCMGWDMLCCMGFGIVRMMLAGDECELKGWISPTDKKTARFFQTILWNDA